MNKNKWIEDILNKAEVIQKVAPPDTLYSVLQSKLYQSEKVNYKTIWLVAASMLLLTSLNFVTLRNTKPHQSETNQNETEEILFENNQLY